MRKLKSIEMLLRRKSLHEGFFYSRRMNEIIKDAKKYFNLIPSELDVAEVHVEGQEPYVSPVLFFENITGKGDVKTAFVSKVPDKDRYRLDAYDVDEKLD